MVGWNQRRTHGRIMKLGEWQKNEVVCLATKSMLSYKLKQGLEFLYYLLGCGKEVSNDFEPGLSNSRAWPL